MNWYAIQVMPALCRGAAGYLDGADGANAGATLAETIMEAGCALRVPLAATGDPMLPGYVLVMPPTDEVAPEQDPLGIFHGDPARWGLQRLKSVPGVVRIIESPITGAAIDLMVTLAKLAHSEAFDATQFAIGDEVEIQRGPLAGMRGLLVRRPSIGVRWCLTFETDGKRYAVDVSPGDARRIKDAARKPRKKSKKKARKAAA